MAVSTRGSLHENDSVAVLPGENIGDVYTGSAMIMSAHYHMSLGQLTIVD